MRKIGLLVTTLFLLSSCSTIKGWFNRDKNDYTEKGNGHVKFVFQKHILDFRACYRNYGGKLKKRVNFSFVITPKAKVLNVKTDLPTGRKRYRRYKKFDKCIKLVVQTMKFKIPMKKAIVKVVQPFDFYPEKKKRKTKS